MRLFVFLFVFGHATAAPQLNNKGDHACTASNPCSMCEGDCDYDNQCAGELRCWQRSYSTSNVPGCAMGGSGDQESTDYCYMPCPDDENGAVSHTNGCSNNLAHVLASTNTASCGINDGTLNIWVNAATAANEIYGLSASSSFTVSGALTAASADITGAFSAGSLVDKIITSDNIVDNAINSGHIQDGTVATGDIADDAVDSSKIADDAVSSVHIQTDAILTRHISSEAVTSDKLPDSLIIGNIYLTGDGDDPKIQADKIVVGGDGLQVTGETTLSSKITGHSLILNNIITNTLSTPAAYTNPANVITNGFEAGASIQKSLDATKYVHAQGFSVNSDQRIKKNIVPVPDDMALGIIRKLDAKYYSYIDYRQRGIDKTIGFIAQDVEKYLPIASSKTTDFIPNILQLVEPLWTYKSKGRYNMHLSDKVQPGSYKFYVTSEDRPEHSIVLETTDGTTFVTDTKYTRVFLYGRQVDDFVMIDKDKIFSVSYAALQQVDKNQVSLTQRITELENTIQQLNQRIQKLEA